MAAQKTKQTSTPALPAETSTHPYQLEQPQASPATTHEPEAMMPNDPRGKKKAPSDPATDGQMAASDAILWCVLEGSSSAFDVPVSMDYNISKLKKAIKKEQKPELDYLAPTSLTLFKLNTDIPLGSGETLLSRLPAVESCQKLDEPHTTLSAVFLEPLTLNHIHIIVRCSSKVADHNAYHDAPFTPVRPPPTAQKRSRSLSTETDDQVARKETRKRSKVTGTFQNTPSKPREVIENIVEAALEKYRPRMKELVADAGQVVLQSWIPKTTGNDPAEMALVDHIKKLAIPVVNGQPSLLLHDLGVEASGLDGKRTERIDDIFSLYRHTVLINTHGSGKTSLTLHGLCQNWGFYAIIRPGNDGIGSQDLKELMATLDDSRDYRWAKSVRSHNTDAVDHMKEKTRHRLLQFLLSRFLILNLLIKEAEQLQGGLHQANHRRLWVLLQAQPTRMFGKDIFLRLSNHLREASNGDLSEWIRKQCCDLERILEYRIEPLTGESVRRPFYCVIDEIQIATTDRMGEFRSDDGKTERPLLREIWSTLTNVMEQGQMLLVLSGTGIQLHALQTVLESSFLKPHPYCLKKNIGAFDDPDAQKRYIEHYLPNEKSEAWKAFLERAWGWCRGRYRFTATLILLVLLAGRRSPHQVLDKYVNTLVNFTPTDGQAWWACESGTLGDSGMISFTWWQFEKLNDPQTMTLRNVLYDQILYGYYSLQAFASDDVEAFIEYGFARTKSRGGAIDLQDDVIDEPLAILAALDWLDKTTNFTHLNCLQHDIGKNAPRKNSFEAYLALYMRKVFEKTPKLVDIFTFRNDFARRKATDMPWQQDEFELVTVSTPAGTNQPTVSTLTPSSGPSSNVGFLAQTHKDVLDWLSKNEEKFAFCFPTESTGPDLLFFVRSKVTDGLLLVVAQARNYRDVSRNCLIQGVRTVTPSWFWKSKDTKHQSPEDAPSLLTSSSDLASQFHDALTKIEPGIRVPGAPYPILRVFASWPANAKLERVIDCKDLQKKSQRKKKSQAHIDEDNINIIDSDLHPLAMLQLENFNNIGNRLNKNWFRGDMEQSAVVFAKAQCNDQEQLRRSERIQVRLAENSKRMQMEMERL